MGVIEIKELTKEYSRHTGIFDLNFAVQKGEVLGFLGANGAGKTTTIRNLMGFIKPDKGSCTILGLDCFLKREQIQKEVGYLPGEISFMSGMTGSEFIAFIAQMKQIKEMSRAKELIEMFELDTQPSIKKMSKGMKQKVGIVCAFMANPNILILDEPTSGLDPLMQNRFIELIQEEKKKGTTIFMSSHHFEEIERTCTDVIMLKSGKMVSREKTAELSLKQSKHYTITFKTVQEAKQIEHEPIKVIDSKDNVVVVEVEGDLNGLIQILCKYSVTAINKSVQSLEDIFIQYYGGK